MLDPTTSNRPHILCLELSICALKLSCTDTAAVGFPKPGFFCKTGFQFWERPKPVFGFGFGSHIIAFTANLRGRGRSKRRRRPQCAQLIMYRWRLTTVACAANSLIDLMMGDLETFVKSLNAWSGISDAVKWRWWIPESWLMSDFICEVTEVTLNDTNDFDAWLMNIKLSHCQLKLPLVNDTVYTHYRPTVI